MAIFFKKHKVLIFLNLLLIAFYFLVLSNIKYDISEETMFFAPDAQQYRNTSTEFFDFSAQGDSLTRPFFYPLIILFTYQIFGLFSLWIFQFLCWVVSINLLFLSIRKMVKYPIILFLTVGLMAVNVSLIVFTLNGLTEILTVLLLSVLIHNLTKGSLEKNRGSLINLVLMSLLVVTRPVFFYPFIAYLLFHLYRFIIGKKMDLKMILLVFLCISPVLFQITLMKVKYDKWKVSDIDSITLTDYLLAQTVRWIEPEIEYQNSILKAREIENKKEFLWENKSAVFKLFIQNINESLEGYPSLFFIKEYEQKGVGKKMYILNTIYYWLHFIFFAPVIISIFWWMKRFKWKKESILFLYFLFSYVVFTCGISFFQGDRFLIAMLPVWIFIYAIVAQEIIQFYKSEQEIILK